MPIYIGNSRGFAPLQHLKSLYPHYSYPSPNTTLHDGEPWDEPIRTRLTSSLERDMLRMGTNNTVIDDPCFHYVVTRARAAFMLEKEVNPIHLKDVYSYNLEIRKFGPGIPWQPMFKTSGAVMDDRVAQNSIRWFWHRIKEGEKIYPPDCQVLYRAHVRDEHKIHADYSYPIAITLMEACFALPLIEEYMYEKGNHPLGYDFDMATGGGYKLRRHIECYESFACIAFSGFDKTVSDQLIRIAFDILADNLDLCKYRNSGMPDPNKLGLAWDYLVKYFLYTPLRMPNGDRWMKTSGIPSGSYFTQLVRSIVNWIMINYVSVQAHGYMPEEMIVFGEKSLIATNRTIDKWLLEEYIEQAGMEMNLSKSLFSDEVDAVDFIGFNITNGFPNV